ncbi:MAG: OmpA family protein [Burkholderiales bacterium]|jgi:OOP family OmpA-OmpF porin|nr:OmpA family protein [Burkholderiales bacterium]
MRRIFSLVFSLVFLMVCWGARDSIAQPAPASSTSTPSSLPAPVVPANFIAQPGQVVVSGTVPDERTKAEVFHKLQNIYGAGKVIDQIDVRSDVVTPRDWSQQVINNVISSSLKSIHRGQLEIDGTQIRLQGEVESEPVRQSIIDTLARSLNQSYRIVSSLRVAVNQQVQLDKLLANRIVEFHTNSATLTDKGQQLLDELADILPQINSDKIQIIGHTDVTGNRATNLALSLARAEAVRAYLVEKGLSPNRFETMGVGPDQPVASNATPEGRAKNRRIEFRATNYAK